ncbi:MAG TPA: hypothetical protein VEA69_18730 [Tepidisphaeraceae bacterium]|nr:hypothetical protein [Tepidisphaeraceae bacterium]
MRTIAPVQQSSPTVTSAPRRRPIARALGWVARHERGLFWVMVLVHLVPVWAFTYLPTTDGAAHVANADVMRRYHAPEAEAFRKYYYVSGTPSPNLAGHVILAGLMYVVPPTVAEKVLVSLYVVGLAAGMRYAVRAIRPRAGAVAWVALPMTYSFLLGQGFYNFCLSLAAYLFTVGFWFRHHGRTDLKRGAGLFALSVVLYACHLFALVVACGTVALTAGWWVIRAWWEGRKASDPGRRFGRSPFDSAPACSDRQSGVSSAVRAMVIAGLVLLPTFVVAVVFRPSTNVSWLNHDVPRSSLREDLLGLLQFQAMVSYRKAEGALGAALVAVLGGLTLFALVAKARRRRAWSRWDVLLLLPVGLAAAYFRAGDATSIHFYIPPRTMYLAFLTLGLWLAAQPLPRAVRGAVPLFCGVIALGFVASHGLKYRQFKPQLAEFVSAGDHIARGSTFLPLTFAPQGRDAAGRPTASDVAPFYMASGYIAVRRGAVDLRNYEARTDHFPVRFRDEVSPFAHLTSGNGLEQIPPRVLFDKFERAGGRVDYVLIWGRAPDQRAAALAGEYVEAERAWRNSLSAGDAHELAAAMARLGDAARLEADLAAHYERVELPGARWTELYKRK